MRVEEVVEGEVEDALGEEAWPGRGRGRGAELHQQLQVVQGVTHTHRAV